MSLQINAETGKPKDDEYVICDICQDITGNWIPGWEYNLPIEHLCDECEERL